MTPRLSPEQFEVVLEHADTGDDLAARVLQLCFWARNAAAQAYPDAASLEEYHRIIDKAYTAALFTRWPHLAEREAVEVE